MNTADRFIRSCSSWDDFCLRIGKLSNGEKGRSFERLVQLYLQTQPKYADLSKVWLLAEVPQKVRQKLNLPERDEGIDLIARDRRGILGNPGEMADRYAAGAQSAGVGDVPSHRIQHVPQYRFRASRTTRPSRSPKAACCGIPARSVLMHGRRPIGR
jgi:hypothetical protein